MLFIFLLEHHYQDPLTKSWFYSSVLLRSPAEVTTREQDYVVRSSDYPGIPRSRPFWKGYLLLSALVVRMYMDSTASKALHTEEIFTVRKEP